ncbi:chromate transporter [Pontibacter chinhatensis]|uniref:Chromate transporter n=2 Tax=Pontibacter chinhatensis TaxID=1436961 RepID=A0A1I2XMZ0_9BACT|nr:chromate transporter [Pontibacter chinhatensis]
MVFASCLWHTPILRFLKVHDILGCSLVNFIYMQEVPAIPAIHQTNMQIFLRFLKFGFLAWGGPVAQIAMLKRELVEEEKWITQERFNRSLAVYQVLPGPEAHELCVYFGMVAGGRVGGFLAGLGFMLPGFLLMLLLTWLYVSIGIGSPLIQAVFIGFQAAVIALIFAAVHRIGKHALFNWKLFVIAAAAFIAYVCGVGFFVVLPLAGMAYVFWMKGNIKLLALSGIVLVVACVLLFNPLWGELQQPATVTEANPADTEQSPVAVFWAGLKAGLLTFGGAYTVIPFIQQDAVMQQGWLTNRQFLDGIALSGILPAPLIIFSTFVGYFGAGWLGTVIMTFAIFLPAFSFTLLGHGLVEKVITNTALHSFLDGVTAGVIGLIAVTALQLFRSTITGGFTLLVFALSMLILYRIKSKFTVVFVILGAGLLGIAWRLVGGFS